MKAQLTRRSKFLLFSSLYFAQGLPYGFFTQALPVFLRESKASLAAIGGASLLTLPWALKFLWAPLADRYGWQKVGLRRSWILPLQFLAVVFLVFLSFLEPEAALMPIMIGFLICNFLAAAQDVATDGLAVDLLKPEERGWANTIQVGGYRIGMIVGGSAMLFVLARVGWHGAMTVMALILAIVSIPVFFYREPARPVELLPPRSRTNLFQANLLNDLQSFLRQPNMLVWLGLLLVFKAGHQAASSMIRPWLVDHHYTLEEIGELLGVMASGAGLTGAFIGGWVASRWPRIKLLPWLALGQAVATSTYLLAVLTDHAVWKVAFASALDNGMSGIATVTLFAAMMDRCRPSHSAGDYTLQASLIVISQMCASAFAGVLADQVGYSAHFVVVSALSALIVTYAFWSRKKLLAAVAIVLGVLVSTPTLHAQSTQGSESDGARSGAMRNEVGIGFGPLLPSRIGGVREVLNGWALRGTRATGKGIFELEWFTAHGDGAAYNAFLFDYRLDVMGSEGMEFIPVHFLLGLHVDSYTPAGASLKNSGGWHYGGGVSLPLGGGVQFRADFKHRFSPGNSLIVLAGLSFPL